MRDEDIFINRVTGKEYYQVMDCTGAWVLREITGPRTPASLYEKLKAETGCKDCEHPSVAAILEVLKKLCDRHDQLDTIVAGILRREREL